jgi:hypothetical protein
MGGCHLPDASNVKTHTHQSIRYILCWGIEREVGYHSLYALLRFGVKSEIHKVIVF